jgi:hypothetical protein
MVYFWTFLFNIFRPQLIMGDEPWMGRIISMNLVLVRALAAHPGGPKQLLPQGEKVSVLCGFCLPTFTTSEMNSFVQLEGPRGRQKSRAGAMCLAGCHYPLESLQD